VETHDDRATEESVDAAQAMVLAAIFGLRIA